MKIVGCDLHARQQTIAMVDTGTGEFTEKTLAHEGNQVREFYAALEGPVAVGIEATGAMQWFLQLLEEFAAGARAANGGSLSDYLDALDRATGSMNVAAGPSSVGEDTNSRPEHITSHSAQSRTAARPSDVDCNWTEGTASLISAQLHQSKAGRTAALIRAIAAADLGTGRASRKRSPATAPGAPLVDASRCGTSDGIGDGGVSGRPEPLRQRQERGQLHRNDSL
jgi:hypothetical protein